MCNYNEEPNFGKLLGRSHYLLVGKINRNFQEAGLDLTKDQYLVLKLLWKDGAMNQQFISKRLDKDKYNITKLVDGLEKRGFVKRMVNKKDRRMKFIHLTKEGKAIQDKVELIVRDSFAQLLLNIPENELDIAAKVLSSFIDNLLEENKDQ